MAGKEDYWVNQLRNTLGNQRERERERERETERVGHTNLSIIFITKYNWPSNQCLLIVEINNL